jgi:cell division protein FtsZ
MDSGGLRGARGVLLNITGSSRLGLHEVNEACTLVREAAGNDDVQINFGVVLDEEMLDEVKITVIATGFARENLPKIDRRGVPAEAVAAPPPPMFAVTSAEPVWMEEAEPEFAGLDAEAPLIEPVHEQPAPMTMAAAAMAPNGSSLESEPLFDDLEVPAILRSRRRGLVQ